MFQPYVRKYFFTGEAYHRGWRISRDDGYPHGESSSDLAFIPFSPITNPLSIDRAGLCRTASSQSGRRGGISPTETGHVCYGCGCIWALFHVDPLSPSFHCLLSMSHHTIDNAKGQKAHRYASQGSAVCHVCHL